MIACPDCGTLQEIPALPPRGTAHCIRCDGDLERAAGRSVDAALACALATLLLLFPANVLTLMSLSVAGVERNSRLGSGIAVLWSQGWILIAVLLGAFGIVLPVVRFGLLSASLGAVRLGCTPRWLGPAFRWATFLDLWAMPDVFLIGCIVGYSRVAAFVPLRIGAGGWCFVAAALLSMITDAALDRRTVWRAVAAEKPPPPAGTETVSCTMCDMVFAAAAADGKCPRCRARLASRKPDALVRTAALVVAGFALYAPANLYPMSELIAVSGTRRHTIFSGVAQLAQAHLWPLAALIFCTSIAIPLLKLIGLTWFVLSVRRRSRFALVTRTKLHRIIDRLGRWSNIDVFTIAAFAPLIQFRQLASVQAAPGALAFLLVVVLTMIGSRAFDPRLMWDAAEAQP
jgi:paraquat-inducible protein A